MDRTKKIVIVAMLILLVLVLLLMMMLFFFSRQPQEAAKMVDGSRVVPVAEAPGAPRVEPIKPEARNLIRFSMQFVERYGSFSSEAGYQNLKDLETVITPAFWKTVEAQIKSVKSGEFYGVTTRSVVAKVEAQTATAARVVVSTKRQETRGNTDAKSFDQDLKLVLQKQGTIWLVDGAEWVAVKK